MEGLLRTDFRYYANQQMDNCRCLAKDLGDRWIELERVRVELVKTEREPMPERTAAAENTKNANANATDDVEDEIAAARRRGAAQSRRRFLKQRYDVLRTVVTSYQRTMAELHKDIETNAEDLSRMSANSQFGLPNIDDKISACLHDTAPMRIINRLD